MLQAAQKKHKKEGQKEKARMSCKHPLLPNCAVVLCEVNCEGCSSHLKSDSSP